MKLLGLALIMVGNSVFASTNGYDLKIDLSMNGKQVSTPRLILKAGEVGKINQSTDGEKSFIEVVATEGQVQKHKGILMNFTVGHISKNGERTIVSKPQILAKENEPASITISEKDGTEISLSVLAKRKSL
ncbi:MAG: hypothetical protein ACK5P7_03980 [Bdellovibrio sp.]